MESVVNVSPSEDEIKAVRVKGVEAMRAIKADPALQTAFQSDPLGTLGKLGLPEEAARELVIKVMAGSGDEDVSGYDMVVHNYYKVDNDMWDDQYWYDDLGNLLKELLQKVGG